MSHTHTHTHITTMPTHTHTHTRTHIQNHTRIISRTRESPGACTCGYIYVCVCVRGSVYVQYRTGDVVWRDQEDWHTLCHKQEFTYTDKPYLQVCVGRVAWPTARTWTHMPLQALLWHVCFRPVCCCAELCVMPVHNSQ